MPVRNDFSPGEFCWVDLAAHDMEAAAAWYDALFGWSHMTVPSPGGGHPYAFFMHGAHGVGGLGQMSDEMKAQGIPPMWNSYVSTADCAATEAKVKQLGGKVTVPTMDVPGFGKLAFFLDPEGGSFAAWQSTNSAGPGLLLGEPTGMCWNELMTRDASKAKEFYGALLGWDFAAMPMGDIEYTMLKVAGKDAGGMMPMAGPQFDGIPANWMVYFAVADCKATADKAAATGGKVHVPPTRVPVGTFAVLADPQGAVFSVITLESPNC